MERQAFESSLRALARRVPFRAFTVELVNGEQIEVEHPEALAIMRGGVAVHQSTEGVLTLLDHEGVCRLVSEPVAAH